MRALITGGSGYFGSLLVKQLLLRGWECRVFDINPFNDKNVDFFQGDIRNIDAVLKACENVDVIFHNVAQVPLAKDKKLFNEVNIGGTENVLNSCIQKGINKLIYTSSSAVYGIPNTNPVTENMVPTPMESYGLAKYLAEQKCKEYISDNLDVIIIRPRTILGHGRLGIFQILFEWILQGNNIPVLGRGDNLYQFIHADDLAEAIILSADQDIKSGVYNCGAEEYGTMREVLEQLCEYSNTNSNVKSVPFWPTVLGMKVSSLFGLSPLGSYHALMYGRSMYFDITKAKKELLWKPKFSNNTMFKESYDWYCQNRDTILYDSKNSSLHQSRVKEGILSLVRRML